MNTSIVGSKNSSSHSFRSLTPEEDNGGNQPSIKITGNSLLSGNNQHGSTSNNRTGDSSHSTGTGATVACRKTDAQDAKVRIKIVVILYIVGQSFLHASNTYELLYVKSKYTHG